MDTPTLIVAIIGSAAFGAVAGKLLEAFVLAPKIHRYERKKWLRQTKIEAFSMLAEEILSLGTKKMVFDVPWRFRGLAAKAILLLEDNKLIQEINYFIEELYKINTCISKMVKANLPDDFSAEMPNGKRVTKKDEKDIEKGIALDIMEKNALGIVKKLGENLRNT